MPEQTTQRRRFNFKRQIRAAPTDDAGLRALAAQVRYGGNPDHKRNPGDFGLTPPSRWRPGKTPCDDAAVFRKDDAVALLRDGVLKGMISVQMHAGFPQTFGR